MSSSHQDPPAVQTATPSAGYTFRYDERDRLIWFSDGSTVTTYTYDSENA